MRWEEPFLRGGIAKLKQLGGDLDVDEPESPISIYIWIAKEHEVSVGFADR
jgi:hypothetical protein